MESEWVDAPVAIEGEAGRRRPGAVREEVEVASDRPIWPVGRVGDGTAPPPPPPPPVENVAAAAVGQQLHPLGDTPPRPVRRTIDGRRAAKPMEAAPSVEHITRRMAGA